MSIEERLNKLENNYNVLSQDINKINQNISNINNKINIIDTNTSKLDQLLEYMQPKKKIKKNNNNPHSLAQIGNPFYDAAMEFQDEESDNDSLDEESSNNMSISQSNVSISEKKRGKYKPRNPLYFYYNINGNIYKYTCKVKDRKNILDFRCSDTNCKARGYFYKKDDTFKPNIFLSHIEYEDHSYIINEIYQNKFVTYILNAYFMTMKIYFQLKQKN